MNLDELQSVRDRERQTDKLQQLRESFYADAGEFISQLRSERDRAADRADDPFDAPEVNRLTDEINTAEQTVEAIYEKRVGKIVKAASFAAADLPAEVDGMTAEEQVLFDTLVGDIKGSRERVLDVLAGEAPDTGEERTTEPPAPPADTTSEVDVSAADVMGGSTAADHEPPEPPGDGPSNGDSQPPGSDRRSAVPDGSDPTEGATATGDHPAAEPGSAGAEEAAGEPLGESAAPEEAVADYPVRKDGGTESVTAPQSQSTGVQRARVRITEAVDAFVGFDDRDYDLDRNDVVTLPETNAELLVEQDVAEQLD